MTQNIQNNKKTTDKISKSITIKKHFNMYITVIDSSN